MDFQSVAIVGGGESGIGAALLAQKKGLKVLLSDYGKISIEHQQSLNKLKIPFEENGHTLDKLKNYDLVVKSPGVGDHTDVIKGLSYYGKKIISEIEFGFYFTEKRIIGITGSNGKTTTTGLIDHLLKAGGVKSQVGGNIGDSFARLVAEEKESTEVYVLELSSFQLDGIETFRPDIAVLLNITPDHLDRYDHDFEKYKRAKWRIVMNQRSEDLLIYNADLEVMRDVGRQIAIEEKNYSEYSLLTKSGQKFDITKSSLKGRHNRFNALCAIEVALEMGVDRQSVEKGLVSFKNVPHRLEVVKVFNSITFINDSKATNVDAVYYALDAMESPVIWIVGGTDKGNDYEPIRELVEEKVKHRIYLGKDNAKLIAFFGEGVECRSMEEAVKKAAMCAKEGDVVLLSPACASFDLFKNYEDRGAQFKEAVYAL
ncbi:UDP-N-acetylmuramoyl-L-alanine--D-glutamate ligase [Portibacter marinus]|uniref:UDP-N-acetylmuramoyl-L-alanine--D-glutamate ligase n=1 Tax=Portibacter marinus TaxID=2898660 RepID=UPI001F36CB17|nr:UDP-N-acetylmuramoyl-L-alanine--D-glutamate ligase [Portibacter marinus]